MIVAANINGSEPLFWLVVILIVVAIAYFIRRL